MGIGEDSDAKLDWLTAPRLEPDMVDAEIVGEQYHVFPGTTLTVCALRLKNGFVVTGESACVSPQNFDYGIGRTFAKEAAKRKVWDFMGYQMRTDLMRRSEGHADEGTPV